MPPKAAVASFNSSGDQFITACRGVITYFDSTSGKKLSEFREPVIGTNVVFSPNGNFFVVHEPDQPLELWRIKDQKLLVRFSVEKPYKKFFASDDSAFYSLARNGEFNAWTLESLK